MSEQDIRWVQRFNHYQKALALLEQATELATERGLSYLEKQGLIKAFEFTYELAWKTLKDLLENEGYEIIGSRSAIERAFNRGLIKNEEVWVEMIKSRNLTSHTYNQEVAEAIFKDVVTDYYDALEKLRDTLLNQKKERNL